MYYMNKDKRCIVAEGSANGQTNITLHYADEDLQPALKENCCIKFYNCLKGSSSYRDMKVRISNITCFFKLFHTCVLRIQVELVTNT